MRSPAGWVEPGQRPEFDEYTLVLSGAVEVEHEGGTLSVRPGQAVLTRAGEWVRYSTPEPDGAEYVAVCLPAFAPDIGVNTVSPTSRSSLRRLRSISFSAV